MPNLISTITSHNWLALVMLAAIYVRKLLSPDSAFPVTLPANVRPLVLGAAGAVVTAVGAREAGEAWQASLMLGFGGLVAVGFFDGLLAAIFGAPANAPTWAKALVFLIDDAGGGGAGGSPAGKRGFARVDALVALLGGLAAAGVTLAVCALLSGCLSSAPVVPQTPENAAQIASCENTATWHNGFVVGDFALTGAGAGLAAAGAAVPASNDSLKTGLAYTAAGVGGAALIATGLVAYTASNFTNSQCQSVVGPLPSSPFGAKPATPPPTSRAVPGPGAPFLSDGWQGGLSWTLGTTLGTVTEPARRTWGATCESDEWCVGIDEQPESYDLTVITLGARTGGAL